MKFKVDHFFLVFACFSLCGCTSSFVYYTESECLAKLCDSGYASYAGKLGDPPTPEGTPINNPYVLIGRWSFSCEWETISVGLNLTRHSPKGIPIDVKKDKVYGVWEFRADGTYSDKIQIKHSPNSMLSTTSTTGEGTWKLSAGTLEIITTRSPFPQYNGTKTQFKVFECGKGEIIITQYTPGSKAYHDWLKNNQSAVKTANDRSKSMGKWAPIIRRDVGFDKRGYLVEREFVQYKDGKGLMHIRANPPKRYKYIGPVAPTKSMVPSGGQQQVTVESVQNGGVSTISTDSKSPYSLESFTWEEGSDFAAFFKVKMHGECSIDSFFAIRQEFDAQVRNAYLQSHPSADSRHLQIEVRPNLENGMISGRVAVLTIVPASLTYDANTRRGKLSVRFSAGQAEEARTWIRKNIETLARDKNIALTTGTLPPEATYYSLGEKIDGNVMEIEFRTE